MSASATPNERPLKQIRAAVARLVAEGNSDEAFDVLFSALATVLQENARLELLNLKLRKAGAGKSNSEKLDAAQLSLLLQLLDEEESEELDVDAELAADAELDREIEEAEDAAASEDPENSQPKKRQRNKALKTPGLEERHTYLEPPPDQADWEQVGETTTERLRWVSAQFYKEVIHHPVMQDPEPREDGSEGHVVVEAPPTIVPDGMPGNDVVAMLLIRKYAEHSTLYRLHGQFLREQGVDLPETTLGDWVAWGGRALQRLMPPLLARVTDAFLVGTDATGLRVLDSGPDHVHRGTFHVYRGTSGEGDAADIVFHYTPTGEAEEGPWSVLAGRQGYVQADASNSFDRLFNGKVALATEVGCHYHARRPFKANSEDPRSAYVLQLVGRLFKIEKLADTKRATWQERTTLRQQRSAPVLEKLKRYLAKLIHEDDIPGDPLISGAKYYINHWEALTRFIEDGRLPLTNNAVEYEFRGIRIGERNYLFAGSDEAAERAAAIYSIIATAKAHGLNLFEYLVHVLDRLSHPMSQDAIVELLPHRWKANQAVAEPE